MNRYANNAKKIKNKPHINEDPKDALLREYQEEIMRLKMALDKRKKTGGKGKGKRRMDSMEGMLMQVCKVKRKVFLTCFNYLAFFVGIVMSIRYMHSGFG